MGELGDLNAKFCPGLGPRAVHQDKTSKRDICTQLGLWAQTQAASQGCLVDEAGG